MRTKLLIGTACTGTLLLATAWYFGIRHDGGPLSGSTGDKLCMVAGQSDSITIGHLPMRNTGSSAITITDVSIINPDGVEDGGALLVPQASASSQRGWPFGNGPFDGEDNRPRLAVGAQLPANPTEDLWLVVHADRQDIHGEARLTGIRVDYRAGLRRYTREMGPSHTLRPGRCS